MRGSRAPRRVAACRTIATAVVLFSATVGAVPPSAQAATGCADVGGAVEANQTCHVHIQTPTYTIDMRYPLDYPDQQVLADFVKHDRDRFIDFVTKEPPRDTPYEHDQSPRTYRSGTPTSGTRSVVFETFDDTGAHPVTGFKAFNLDVGTNVPITFDTLFKPGADPVALLDPIVQRQMDKQWSGYGGPAAHNTLGAQVYQNFALTDDAVIFFIAQGMWLPEVAGPQRVEVPRSELAPALV